ncbi:MAG: hypothetical protein ACTHJH_14235 [Marmoricola sp.]
MIPRALLALVLPLLAVGLAGCRDMGPGGHGKVSEVVYRVSGHGSAQVRYAATGMKQLTPARSVQLPWSHEAHIVDNSGLVYRVLVKVAGRQDARCSIEVNGVGVAFTVRRQGDVMECAFVK